MDRSHQVEGVRKGDLGRGDERGKVRSLSFWGCKGPLRVGGSGEGSVGGNEGGGPIRPLSRLPGLAKKARFCACGLHVVEAGSGQLIVIKYVRRA